jgi:ketosteroid isomerase-like protein
MTTNDPKLEALETVRTLERRRIAATGANDVKALEPLLDDNLVYINSVGDTFGKAEYLHALDSGSLAYDKDFDVRETEYRAFDDLVILVGIMLGHSRLDGEQQVFHFRCISVWRQQAGEWRMAAWQSSSSSFTTNQMFQARGEGLAA